MIKINKQITNSHIRSISNLQQSKYVVDKNIHEIENIKSNISIDRYSKHTYVYVVAICLWSSDFNFWYHIYQHSKTIKKR